MESNNNQLNATQCTDIPSCFLSTASPPVCEGHPKFRFDSSVGESSHRNTIGPSPDDLPSDISVNSRLAADGQRTEDGDAPACFSNTVRSFIIPASADLPHNNTDIPLKMCCQHTLPRQSSVRWDFPYCFLGKLRMHKIVPEFPFLRTSLHPCWSENWNTNECRTNTSPSRFKYLEDTTSIGSHDLMLEFEFCLG